MIKHLKRMHAAQSPRLFSSMYADRKRVFVDMLKWDVPHDGKFEKIEGSDFELPCELVLLAMGFLGPQQEGLLDSLGVELDGRGNVVRDPNFMTNEPGVFACGDMGRGQSLIVWAIAEGRSCAASVDRWLMGATDLPSPLTPDATPIGAR